MKCVFWNTGAHYTEFGQRIGATVLESGHVLFADIDRNITQVTTRVMDHMFFNSDVDGDVKRFLMTEYNYSRMQWPRDYDQANALEQLTRNHFNGEDNG